MLSGCYLIFVIYLGGLTPLQADAQAMGVAQQACTKQLKTPCLGSITFSPDKVPGKRAVTWRCSKKIDIEG